MADYDLAKLSLHELREGFGKVPGLNPIIAEMHGQNDRGAAITGTVYMEQWLRNTIIKQWPPMSNTTKNRVFTGYGPLASLSALIDVATAMGLIHRDMRGYFVAIKHIRNDAAHTGDPFSFTSEKVRKHVRPLAALGETPDTIPGESLERNRFTGSVKMLSAYLFVVGFWREKHGSKTVFPPILLDKAARKNRPTKSSSDSNAGS